jgi:hypothetical protein
MSSTILLPPRDSFVLGTAVINTHTVLHQPPWSFGFDSQTRGTRENRAPPCVKVPGSSRVPSPRSLVCGGQTSPHNPRLVVSHSTCSPLSLPHAHNFVLGTAVINNNNLSSTIPLPPGKQLYNRYCSNKHTHIHTYLRFRVGLRV